MRWRLDLGGDWPYVVRLVVGSDPQLAVWLSDRDIDFFAVPSGAYYGRLTLATDAHPGAEAWRLFLDRLRAPNGAYLPVAWAGQTAIFTSHDGRLHLYHLRDSKLILDLDGQQVILPFEDGAALVTVGLDRELGTVAALSDDGQLHMYQQGAYVGLYPVEADSRATILLAVPDGADYCLLVESDRFRRITMGGQIRQQITDLPPIHAAACSPRGELIVTADATYGVLRVYDASLELVAQEKALDVLARAPSLQLPEDVAWPALAPHTLDIDDSGRLAFAVGGLLCVTHITDLSPVARPRVLL